MSDSVFLQNDTARRLYAFACRLPIFDYHCHLSPREIFEDKTFFNLSQLWLSGDHYKWRVMRAFGVDERFVAGDADDYAKFEKFCEAMPSFIGNPVYHWAHFELKQYFGILKPLCSSNAKEIWDKTVAAMADGSFSARKLIEKSNVRAVITTDDPCDALEWHRLIKKQELSFEVLPCFRPDKAVNIENDGFCEYIAALGASANINIDGLDSLLDAVEKRLNYFVENGCTAADISFTDFPAAQYDRHLACAALKKRLNGEELDGSEIAIYKFAILKQMASLLAKHDIVMQLHIGVMRNCNRTMFERLGADCGGDSVANAIDIDSARALFDRIECDGGLPRTIVYTLNPTAYYPIATLLGDFAGAQRGKLQLGAAWWFADHRDGIKEQLRLCAATGGLGLFNGMLTDSRSFTSYVRHDYFRRILCSVIAEWVDGGEYPDDMVMLEKLIFDICFGNADRFFGGKI